MGSFGANYNMNRIKSADAATMNPATLRATNECRKGHNTEQRNDKCEEKYSELTKKKEGKFRGSRDRQKKQIYFSYITCCCPPVPSAVGKCNNYWMVSVV